MVPTCRYAVVRVRLERTHDVIPQHDVLPIICVWYGMMRVVCAYREDGYGCEGDVQRRNIEPRVVEGGEAAPHDEEEDARDGVDGNQEPRREVDGEDVVVLAQYELERMYVDGIGIATCGHNLPVMMLVHVRVHGAVMERAVEGRVEEIVHDEKGGQRDASIGKGDLVKTPLHIWAGRHELQIVECHDDDRNLAQGDESAINCRERV